MKSTSQQFDEKVLELRKDKNNLRKLLIGFASMASKNKIEGNSDILKKEKKDWENKGGETTIYYKISDNFKTGYITFRPICYPLEFVVCDADSKEAERKEYESRIEKEGKRLGMIMEAIIN